MENDYGNVDWKAIEAETCRRVGEIIKAGPEHPKYTELKRLLLGEEGGSA